MLPDYDLQWLEGLPTNKKYHYLDWGAKSELL